MSDLLYVPQQGPQRVWDILYRLDPRCKLLFVASLSVYLAIASRPEVILLVLLALHLLCAVSRSTRRRTWTLWKSLWPLIATIILLNSLRWRAPDAWISVGPVSVTRLSLWLSLGVAARIAALTLGFSLLLWTTEPGDAIAGFARLGLPFELGFAAVMAMQYVVTFKSSYLQILDAQQSRGLTWPRRNPIRAVRAFFPVLVPLIISALRSADNLSVALQSRGFGGKVKRTSRRTLAMRARDWAFVLVAWAVLLALTQV
jgi:energy-coupling factor transporter transmembrane protein EcfT